MAETHLLTFQKLRQEVWQYVRANYKVLLGFAGLNVIFLAVLFLGLGGVGSLWFLLWGVGCYLFHFAFFRWYFNRRPYVLTVKFFDTLLPALKVMFMLLLGLTLLAYLPSVPLLFGGNSETLKNAVTLFIGNFMDGSNSYNVFISLILLLLAPVIAYRPLLGWIASVIGRSGAFRNVFKHTSGYYKLFLKILVVFYIVMGGLGLIDSTLGLHRVLFYLGVAPIVVIFEIFLAKTYEILILD